MLVQCDGGSIEECRIIEVLGDHRLCRHHAHQATERGVS
jgi:hypothetical protein